MTTNTAHKPTQETTKEYPNILISEMLTTKGALFNSNLEIKKENPVMTGTIDVGDLTMPVSAFKEKSESGLEYLSLSLGDFLHFI